VRRSFAAGAGGSLSAAPPNSARNVGRGGYIRHDAPSSMKYNQPSLALQAKLFIELLENLFSLGK
jgi:hypothetical protein